MSSHWFLQEEVTWRTAASGIWTFFLSFIIFVSFLFIWIFSPFHHVINICDYFFLVISFYSWFISSCVAIICGLFVKIYVNHYSVVYKVECTRLHMVSKYFFLGNIFSSLCLAFLCGLIAMFVTSFSTKEYSVYAECHSSSDTFRCLNESYLIFVLFGISLGFFKDISSKVNHRYTIQFPMEQQGRVLSVKVNLTAYLLSSGKQSLTFVKYFLIIYYFFGVFPRYLLSVVLDYPFCDGDLVGFGNFTAMMSAAWSLWIFGTLLLLLIHMSWHLFNSYYTKMYVFPVDSVFPEDEKKLLTNNLNEKQPHLIQHLAFQYLSYISMYSRNKRKEIFFLKIEAHGKRSLKWDVISLECIERINKLTEKLTAYHQKLTASQKDSKHVADSNSMHQSTSAGFSTPHRRRPPLSDLTNTSQPNISYFEVSPSNNLNTSRQLDRTGVLNNSQLLVPTPKLWTRRQNMENTSYPAEECIRSKDKVIQSTSGSRLSRLTNTLKQIPFVAYFVKDIPDRVFANVFSNHNIYKWAIESISFLAAASLTDDDHGFAQQRLPDILNSLFDLLAILEKTSKLPVNPTSEASAFLLRRQQGLKSETKSAIYRIINTFSRHIDDIPVKREHQRRVALFLEQKE